MEIGVGKNCPWQLGRIGLLQALLVGLLVFGGPQPGRGEEADPLTQTKQYVGEIISILSDQQLAVPERREERKKKVEAVVDNVFDFEEMAKRSLARDWDEKTPEQQKEFVGLFARLVKQRYIGKVDSYSGQKVLFKNQSVKDGNAIIYSLLVDHGTNIPIDYKLIRKDNGKWLGYDVRVENISLVANYRQDFASIIRQDGFEGLLRKIRDKVEKPEAAQ